MDFGALYDFSSTPTPGIGCLVGIGLVVSLIACVIMERRTRKTFVNHEPDEDDWSFSMTTKTTSNVFAFVPNGDQTMRIAF